MKVRLITLTSLIFAQFLNGATILGSNLNQGDGTDLVIVASDSTPVASGTGIAAVGYFTAGFDPMSQTYQSLVSNFTILAQDNFTGTGGDTGFYLINFSGTIEAPIGTELYTFIGNSLTLDGSTEFGLVKSTAVVDSDTPGSPDSNSLTLPQAGSVILYGSLGGQVVTDASVTLDDPQYLTDSFVLVAIPEPSSFMLGAIGALGLLRRRR